MLKIVGIKGIEPIQSKDNRFTVCPDSPASAYSHDLLPSSKRNHTIGGMVPEGNQT